jgi:hypothetical protein
VRWIVVILGAEPTAVDIEGSENVKKSLPDCFDGWTLSASTAEIGRDPSEYCRCITLGKPCFSSPGRGGMLEISLSAFQKLFRMED